MRQPWALFLLKNADIYGLNYIHRAVSRGGKKITVFCLDCFCLFAELGWKLL